MNTFTFLCLLCFFIVQVKEGEETGSLAGLTRDEDMCSLLKSFFPFPSFVIHAACLNNCHSCVLQFYPHFIWLTHPICLISQKNKYQEEGFHFTFNYMPSFVFTRNLLPSVFEFQMWIPGPGLHFLQFSKIIMTQHYFKLPPNQKLFDCLERKQ